MIIKTFELQKLKVTKVKNFLFYGENDGYKYQVINENFITKFDKRVYRYEENDVLNNYVFGTFQNVERDYILDP